MKAIVFGSNGYIGRNIVHYLKNKDIDVKGVDIQEESTDREIEYNKLDITDLGNIMNINLNVDFIYLFAGLTGTWNGFEKYDAYVNINEKGLLNILSVLIQQDSKARIIYPSTRLVYKGFTDLKLKEDSEKDPKTIYAINKITCEYILKTYGSVFDVNYSIYRICIPYGHMIEGSSSYGTIGFFMNCAIRDKIIPLYGNGNLKRTFTHVEDICQRIYNSSLKDSSNRQVFNIGGETMSLYEVANMLANKYDAEITFKDWPDNAIKIESGDTIFDGGKLNDLLSSVEYKWRFKDWLNR